MRPIDEKIVSMKLDNQDFSRKATETTGIIGGLVKALNLIPGVNLGKTTTDIGKLNGQVNQMNLGSIADGVQNISNKFTALGVIGVTALANIANRAVNAGIALGKSLTTDQVTAGFHEYELKIGSIQTILSNTKWDKTSLSDVKAGLEELNTYADQTIYSFSQMTQNIGRFTAAGVSLGDSTVAIKGLSNLAAASGSSADQLNTAMYQMSQSMSSGKINLMDWNSLVNAGMGGKVTQDALLKTAKNMGIVVDTTKGFRESIGDGWITSKVFLETLKEFGKDQSMIEAATKVRTFTQLFSTLKEAIGSGWATTFENIFGDFDEATTLWSGIAARVTGWIGKVSDSRNKFFKEAADKGAMLNIFDGISNALVPIIQIFTAMKEGFQRVFPPTTVAHFVQLTQTFREFTAGLALSGSSASKVTTIFQGIFAIFSTVFEIAKRLTSAFVSLIPEGTGKGVLDLLVKLAEMSINFNKSVKEGNGLTAAIDGIAKGLKTLGGYIADSIGSVTEMATAIRETLGGAISWIMNLLRPVGAFLKETFSGMGMDEVLGAGGIAAGLVLFKKVSDVLTGISGIFKTFKSGIKDLLGGLGDALQSFVSQVKYDNLLKIAISVGILAVSLKLLESLKTEDVVQGLTALTTSLGVMLGGMALIQKFSITGGLKASVTLVALSIAVTIMAVALKKVSSLDPKSLAIGVGALIGTVTSLTVALVGMSKLGGKIETSSLQLIALATAVLIMASAIEKFAKMETADLWKGIAAMSVLLVELGIFIKVVNGANIGLTSALGILVMANAIGIMANAISKLSNMDTPSLVTGLVTIAAILTEMIIFSKFASGPSLLVAGVGILAISVALMALMVPIKTLGSMSWGELLKGLTGISIAMLAIAGASYLMEGTIAAGLGMMAMALGLTTLLIPIKAFSSMSWGDMLKGFAGLAIAMTVVAGASLLLAPAIIPMLGFGAGLALMGVAMLAAGVGLGFFATGLVTLAGLSVAAIASLILALKTLIIGLTSIIKDVVKFVIDLGVALLDGIGKIAPKIITTIADLIIKLVAVIFDKIPEFLRLGAEFIINLINGIGEYIPKIVEAAHNMIIDVVNGMTDSLAVNGPRIEDAFLRLFGEIIVLVLESGKDMINALVGWIPGVKKATSKIGETAEKYVRENFKAGEIGGEKGDDFVEGLSTKETAASTAGKQLAVAGTEGLGTAKTKDAGINFGDGFISGIGSKSKDVSKAGSDMGLLAKFGIEDSLDINSPSRVTELLGKYTGQGFVNGLVSTQPDAFKGAHAITDIFTNMFGADAPVTIQSTMGGKAVGQGFAAGIDSTTPAVEKSAKSVSDVAKTQFEESKEWIDDRKYYNELSLKEELKAWQDIQVKYKKGTDERKEADREVYRLKQELIKSDFDFSKSWIDDHKYYNDLSLKDELAAWERVQSRYKEGTEERKEADREVYRLKNELSQGAFANSKRWIDQEKYYNRLSLTDELAAWERVQSQYKEGTDERIEADREAYRVKNEINTQLIQMNEDYTAQIKDANQKLLDDQLALKDDYDSKVADANQKLIDDQLALKDDYDSKVADANQKLADGELQLKEDYASKVADVNKKLVDDELKLKEDYESAVKESNDRLISEEQRLTEEYDKAVEDRTKSLVGFAGLFDEMSKPSDVTGQQLIDNLKGQVDGFNSWSDDIKELSGKAIDEGLLKELTDMGPKAAGEIASLNSLTDEQLTEYSNLWKEKNELAHTESIRELEGLKNDTQSTIEQLRAETNTQLETLNSDWQTKTEELRAQTAIQLESIKNDWYTKTQELRDQTAIQLNQFKKDWKTKTQELRDQTAVQLDAYKKDWETKTKELSDQTATQVEAIKTEWIKKIEELSKGTKDKFVSLETDMKTIGSDTIKGMMTGMKSMEGPLKTQAQKMADSIASTIKSALKIQSPSKITMALGAFTGEGLADGIGGQIKNVASRAKELALTAKDSLNKFLEGFGLPEDDNEIRIKAVVEWDGFDPNDLNAKTLRIMPDTSLTTGMVGEVTANQRQNGDNVRSDKSSSGSVGNNSTVINQSLTFNTRQMSPSEVARKNLQASRQLAIQWGV